MARPHLATNCRSGLQIFEMCHRLGQQRHQGSTSPATGFVLRILPPRIRAFPDEFYPDYRTNHVLRKPSLLTHEVPEEKYFWRRNQGFFRFRYVKPDVEPLTLSVRLLCQTIPFLFEYVTLASSSRSSRLPGGEPCDQRQPCLDLRGLLEVASGAEKLNVLGKDAGAAFRIHVGLARSARACPRLGYLAIIWPE